MTFARQALRSTLFRIVPILTILALLISACGAPNTAQVEPATSAAPAAASDAPATSAAPAASQAPAASDAAQPAANSDAIMTIAREQQATWVRNFNPFASDNRWPTTFGIHESLMIYNTIKGETVPWLATEFAWNEDNTKLTFKTREGVKWSDGQPFSAKDVAFTFNLFPANKGLLGPGGTVWEFLSSVEAPDETTVEFNFKTVYTPGFFDIINQNIVPEHVWKDVADPVKHTNENPVGTGPFTEVVNFQNQIWELHKNPNYWQTGKPYIQGMRFPSYPGNDQANLATINGENDWSSDFVPDIEATFVSKNPDNFGYWFPSTGDTVMLYANTTKAPFDDANVRKAISMCLDREQIVKVAMYDYTHPADATGLSDAYEKWKSQDAIAGGDWVTRDVAKANEMLDAAGLTKSGDTRMTADGQPMAYDINVVSGWTDWVSSVQIASQNLKECGIQATVKPYDFSAWFERVRKGDFDLSIGWSIGGATPFNFYRSQMSGQTSKPMGEIADQNWHRFVSPKADELLAEFATVADFEEQKALVDQMQMEFVNSAPAIPLFPGPQWYEYNTTRFTGFPTEENPYAIGSNFKDGERLLVMTEIKPK